MVDDECVKQMAEAGPQRLPDNWKGALDTPLTIDEIKIAMQKGEGNKAPGRNGIGFQSFTATWVALQGDMLDLLTQMFANGTVTENRNVG